jgi:hypothetical protein
MNPCPSSPPGLAGSSRSPSSSLLLPLDQLVGVKRRREVPSPAPVTAPSPSPAPVTAPTLVTTSEIPTTTELYEDECSTTTELYVDLDEDSDFTPSATPTTTTTTSTPAPAPAPAPSVSTRSTEGFERDLWTLEDVALLERLEATLAARNGLWQRKERLALMEQLEAKKGRARVAPAPAPAPALAPLVSECDSRVSTRSTEGSEGSQPWHTDARHGSDQSMLFIMTRSRAAKAKPNNI